MILIALLSFCALELLDWTGITRGGFPSGWGVAFIQACVNIGWTVFCTTVAYLTMIRPRRSTSLEDSHDGSGRILRGPRDPSTKP